MVDEAPVKTNGNGSAKETPPQAVARTSLEFARDLITLAELQVRLATLDVQNGLSRVAIWGGLLVGGICLMLACLPLCLAVIALFLAETFELSLSAAFAISVFSALVIAAGVIGVAVLRLRGCLDIFDRTWAEWRQNVKWAKETLRRLTTGPTSPTNRVFR